MREPKDGRTKQGRSLAEAAKRVAASESATYPRKRPAAEAGDDALTRLIRMMARQAAREAFSVFREALDARGVTNQPPLDRSDPEHVQEGHAGTDRGPPEGGERFLSVAAVADRLEVSQKTVRRKIASGDLPAHRVGKLIRVSEGDLETYVTQARPGRGGARQ